MSKRKTKGEPRQIDFEAIEMLIKALVAIKLGQPLSAITNETILPEFPPHLITYLDYDKTALELSDILAVCIGSNGQMVQIDEYIMNRLNEAGKKGRHPSTFGELISFIKCHAKLQGTTLLIR